MKCFFCHPKTLFLFLLTLVNIPTFGASAQAIKTPAKALANQAAASSSNRKILQERVIYPFTAADSRLTANIIAVTIIKEKLALSYWQALDKRYKQRLVEAGLDQEKTLALLLVSMNNHLVLSQELWQGDKYTLEYQWTFDELDVFLDLLRLSANDALVGHYQYIFLHEQAILQSILQKSTDQSFTATASWTLLNAYQARVKSLALLDQMRLAMILCEEKEYEKSLLVLQAIFSSISTSSLVETEGVIFQDFLILHDYYSAKNFLALARYAQANKVITRSLSREPDNPTLQIVQAQIWLAQDKNKESIELLKKALNQPSLYSVNYYLLSDLFLRLSRPDLAKQALVWGLRIRPEAERYLALASLQEATDDKIVSLNHALDLRPNYWQAYVALGKSYRQQGDFKRAIDSFRTALAIKENDMDLMSELAQTYLDADETELALLYYQQLNALSPNNKKLKMQLQKLNQAQKSKTSN